MTFTMNALYKNPLAILFARLLRRCTVILSTGKVLKFEKSRHVGECSYKGDLTETEEREYINAMMLMGI